MPINQFAKISPLVNNEGYLLEVNQDGIISNPTSPVATSKRLKNNELGIVYGKNSLVTVYNNEVIYLSSSIYNNLEELENAVSSNTDGSLDGTLCCVKKEMTFNSYPYVSYDICVIKGTSYINLTGHLVRGEHWKISNSLDNTYTSEYLSGYPYTLSRFTVKITGTAISRPKIKIKFFADQDTGVSQLIYEKIINWDTGIKASSLQLVTGKVKDFFQKDTNESGDTIYDLRDVLPTSYPNFFEDDTTNIYNLRGEYITTVSYNRTGNFLYPEDIVKIDGYDESLDMESDISFYILKDIVFQPVFEELDCVNIFKDFVGNLSFKIFGVANNGVTETNDITDTFGDLNAEVFLEYISK